MKASIHARAVPAHFLRVDREKSAAPGEQRFQGMRKTRGEAQSERIRFTAEQNGGKSGAISGESGQGKSGAKSWERAEQRLQRVGRRAEREGQPIGGGGSSNCKQAATPVRLDPSIVPWERGITKSDTTLPTSPTLAAAVSMRR